MNKPSKQNKPKQLKTPALKHARGRGHVRIIGGQWRGRKLDVADVEGLRPTGDRVRETLFNWLQFDIAGKDCLDLFAGTGALGFEALSRHAASVTFVEPASSAQRALAAACELLNVDVVRPAQHQGVPSNFSGACLHANTAEQLLALWQAEKNSPVFDVVFIDPPFEMACQWSVLASLVPKQLAQTAHIYIESPFDSDCAVPVSMPSGCELIREKRFGDVVARLLLFTRVDINQQ